MNIFAVALAESANVQAEQAATAEAVTTAAFLGASMGVFLILMLVWFILQVIADWKIFEKAGEPGWKSIIPIYNTFVEYDICWNGLYGLLFLAAPIISSFLTTGEGAPSWHAIVVTALSVVTFVLH